MREHARNTGWGSTSAAHDTNAVLMHGKNVVATATSFTASDLRGGVVSAVNIPLDQACVGRVDIEAVMIGTTLFADAFISAAT